MYLIIGLLLAGVVIVVGVFAARENKKDGNNSLPNN